MKACAKIHCQHCNGYQYHYVSIDDMESRHVIECSEEKDTHDKAGVKIGIGCSKYNAVTIRLAIAMCHAVAMD